MTAFHVDTFAELDSDESFGRRDPRVFDAAAFADFVSELSDDFVDDDSDDFGTFH